MNKGFTLVEILISITVFSIVITAFLGLFSSAFHWQEKNLNSIALLNSSSYAMEYMSRALRMATKDIAGDCILAGSNFELFGSNHGIRFLTYDNKCQEFYLDSQAIKVKRSSDQTYSNLGSSAPLTPLKLSVDGLNFVISGETQVDTLQPRVTFALEMSAKKTGLQRINIETTISQRALDVAE